MIDDPTTIGVIVKKDGPKRRQVDFSASGGKLAWRDADELRKALSPEEQAATAKTTASVGRRRKAAKDMNQEPEPEPQPAE